MVNFVDTPWGAADLDKILYVEKPYFLNELWHVRVCVLLRYANNGDCWQTEKSSTKEEAQALYDKLTGKKEDPTSEDS